MRFDRCARRFKFFRARNHVRQSYDGCGYYPTINPELHVRPRPATYAVSYDYNHMTGCIPYSPFRIDIASHGAIKSHVRYASSNEE